jgi:hypothetical protein
MCRTGCPNPGSHRTWGECARSARLQVGSAHHEIHRANDRELNAYYEARRQGIQPAGTRMHQIETAVRGADLIQKGDPFGGGGSLDDLG